MIYYFRQQDKNVEAYSVYSNNSLTKTGETFYSDYPSWKIAVQVVRYLNNV